MSNFIKVGEVIINADKIISINKQLLKHGRKETRDDDGCPYGSKTQYALVIKEIEDHNNFLYYDTKEGRDDAFDRLVEGLVKGKIIGDE
jgi:hypothetical protein